MYVDQRLVHIEPWYATPVNLSAPGLDYDPNKELAFRNQVGGQTDCLILFKVRSLSECYERFVLRDLAVGRVYNVL